jgi:opacity protein-like surface antigen
MRSVKLFIAAGAASLLSSAALAADMPSIMPAPQYYAPPAQDFGGWYLRGDIGFSNQKVKDVKTTDPLAYNSVNSLTQQSEFDTAGIFGVGVGYQVNSWFRADVTGQYRGKSNFKGSDVFTFSANGIPNNNGFDNYTASKSELLFLANAYVDLGTWWCVTPFIGAGVGASRVTISSFTDAGGNNAHASTTDSFGNPIGAYAGGPLNPSYATALTESKWNLAWALHTGLAYKVNPNLTMELGYSYVDLGSGTTGNLAAFDAATRGNKFTFKDITSHDLKLGVRWNLDSPPVYAPPPLVRKG